MACLRCPPPVPPPAARRTHTHTHTHTHTTTAAATHLLLALPASRARARNTRTHARACSLASSVRSGSALVLALAQLRAVLLQQPAIKDAVGAGPLHRRPAHRRRTVRTRTCCSRTHRSRGYIRTRATTAWSTNAATAIVTAAAPAPTPAITWVTGETRCGAQARAAVGGASTGGGGRGESVTHPSVPVVFCRAAPIQGITYPAVCAAELGGSPAAAAMATVPGWGVGRLGGRGGEHGGAADPTDHAQLGAIANMLDNPPAPPLPYCLASLPPAPALLPSPPSCPHRPPALTTALLSPVGLSPAGLSAGDRRVQALWRPLPGRSLRLPEAGRNFRRPHESVHLRARWVPDVPRRRRAGRAVPVRRSDRRVCPGVPRCIGDAGTISAKLS